MPDSIVKGDRCYYCGMAVWLETSSGWLGDDDLSNTCSGTVRDGWPRPHRVRRVGEEQG